ncbi:MAG: DUF721 domain-containing protein [Deltaproteobacteria bacterium]|jgi:hypothetical protein|nr:DUF721 domain-containing protein [Deltaproteobacteria bacterium]
MEKYKKNERSTKGLTSLNDIVEESLKNGFLHFVSDRARLDKIWKNVVGEEVSKKTTILSFEMGRLVVSVPGPAFLNRYSYMLWQWRRQINIEYGDLTVEEIFLKVRSRTDEEEKRGLGPKERAHSLDESEIEMQE